MVMLLGVSAQGMKVVKQANKVKTTGFNKTSSAPVNRTYSFSSTGFDKNTVGQASRFCERNFI
jgi:hypothetical protein